MSSYDKKRRVEEGEDGGISSAEVEEQIFEYVGNGQVVPNDVVKVRFHPSVTEIEQMAFWKALNLKEIMFNEGLQTIENRAFGICASLITITFPSTLTRIDGDAFRACHSLREVVLNEGLKTIGKDAFYGCASLERITLPSTIIVIGEGTFSCTNLREVVLNEGLVQIGKMAFGNCKSLESITLPSTVVEVGEEVFKECSNLREVVFTEGLQKVGMGAFHDCSSLESITLPTTAIEIGSQAFYYCSNLTEVGLNEGLQKIGDNAFRECNNLQSIILPSSLIEIGSGAFMDCSSMAELVFTGGMAKLIRWGAFARCRSLDWLAYPNISTRLNTLVEAGHLAIVNKLDELTYVERRAGTVSISAGPMGRGGSFHTGEYLGRYWAEKRNILAKIDHLITYYEMKEATVLFELALWKANIKADTCNRDECRIEVPGPVRDIILQYLYSTPREENYIYIRSHSTDKVMVLDVESSDTIISIKHRIQEEVGVPADQQLMHNDFVPLENDRTLSDYKIKSGTTIVQHT